MKVRFPTQYDPPKRVCACCGTRLHRVFSSSVDKDGTVHLRETGTESLYDSIQSHKESVDINLIVARFAAGDLDVLNRRQGVFTDATQFPQTYAELLNTVIAGREQFEQLPLETRAQFDHSFEKWMASMDDMPNFMEKMGFVLKEEPSETEKPGDPPQPVKSDEV